MTISTDVFERLIPSGIDDCTFALDGHPITTPSEWAGWVWYRNRPTWIEAEAENSLAVLKPLSIHFLIGSKKTDPDSVVCLYPVSSEGGLSSLSRNFDLTASRATVGEGSTRVACIVGRADSAIDINALVNACVTRARAWLHRSPDLPKFSQASSEGYFDGVGFCTWSSLGENVHPTSDTINVLLDRIVEKEIPVRSWILDDGWQDQRTWDSGLCEGPSGHPESRGWERRGLSSFKASRACGDLKEMVKFTKMRLESVKGAGRVEFGVWMTLNGGYWDGIDPESDLVLKYHCQRLTTSHQRIPHIEQKPDGAPRSGAWYLPRPDLAYRFWSDWFTYLKSCGVDFVKVDNQAKFVTVDGISGGEYHAAMWNGMTKAGDEVFGKGRIIHCMAHDEQMFGGVRGLGLATSGERFIFRNSDDFGYIHNNAFSHQKHLIVNVTNSILTSNLCMIPDADMFMTAAQFPLPHALMRALFPGPLLLSDHPGEHDLQLLRKLVARDKSGIWCAAKTECAIQPLSRRVLDLTIAGHGEGRGMWASVSVGDLGVHVPVWNTRHDPMGRVKDKLGFHDLEDALGAALSGEWAVYRHDVGGQASAPSIIHLDKYWDGSGGEVELGEMGCELFTVVPVHNKIALLGLTSVFAGLTPLSRVTRSNKHISMRLALGGTLSLICFDPSPKLNITLDGLPVMATVVPISCNSKPSWRIDVDIEGGGGDDWLVQIEY